MLKNNIKKKGFTLVELIVVMAIIITLISFTVPKVIGYEKKAKEIKAINTAKQMQTAVETLYVRNGKNENSVLLNDLKELISVEISEVKVNPENNNELSIVYKSDNMDYLANINIESNSLTVKLNDKDKEKNKVIYAKTL